MKSTSTLIAKVALFSDRGDVLLLRRSKTSPNRPGLLDLPGGGFDDGETPDQAVVREIEEEVGIKLGAESLTLGYTATNYFDDKSTIRFVYVARIDGEKKISLSDEHDEYYWLSWGEMVERYDHPVYIQALKYIRDHNLLPAGLH